ncbi:hypothetical protein XELAEV_18014963mg [Xenopus laevis]|uniref:Uncharacterized protein n=1 Tax=Xenopus laevis TaxID=8355 RepID=A0A974HVX8_XENLA|nr:hypothetical protein XELAEV_18014963mg [Xenopus laevis]
MICLFVIKNPEKPHSGNGWRTYIQNMTRVLERNAQSIKQIFVFGSRVYDSLSFLYYYVLVTYLVMYTI